VTHPARGALAAIAAGVAALVTATAVACSAGPRSDEGADTARQLAATTPPASTAGTPPVAVAAGTLPAARPTVPPIRLQISSIGVDATVIPTGVDATGDFAVPPSVDEVGWYRYGPGLEATAGSVMIAGHVDSATQGRGAFFRLRELSIRDRLTVTGADGVARPYRVVAREEYRKKVIPLERYFARDGALRLTLITCGGPFDRRNRHYRDNVVVTAVPG
jgi:sortase family protein